jgi:hypothetical protein
MLTSCETEEASTTNEYDGTATAEINGVVWEAGVFKSSREDKFSLRFDKILEDEYVDASESINLNLIIPKEKIIQTIWNRDSTFGILPISEVDLFGSFSTSRIGDIDVTCDIFRVIESDSAHNWVSIDKEVDNFSEVWGSFEMKLYRKEGCNTSPYPDTLHITDGRFYFSE